MTYAFLEVLYKETICVMGYEDEGIWFFIVLF